jgi:hypothetical protein
VVWHHALDSVVLPYVLLCYILFAWIYSCTYSHDSAPLCTAYFGVGVVRCWFAIARLGFELDLGLDMPWGFTLSLLAAAVMSLGVGVVASAWLCLACSAAIKPGIPLFCSHTHITLTAFLLLYCLPPSLFEPDYQLYPTMPALLLLSNSAPTLLTGRQ